MKKILYLTLIFAPIAALLFFSLTRDPRSLPSALKGKKAPSFSLTTLKNEPILFNPETTAKPMVLNFWSTWCGPCEAEYALLQETYQMYAKEGILFYAVLYEDSEENAQQFVNQHGAGVPILLDLNLRAAIDYGVSGVPETFFINKEGIVTHKEAGVLTPEIIYNEIKKIIP